MVTLNPSELGVETPQTFAKILGKTASFISVAVGPEHVRYTIMHS